MLEVTSVSKSYGHVHALTDVSISFAPGEVHAVLGENGAGKSTLMGILCGFIKPDAGTISYDDQQIPLGLPQQCRQLGIELIHQHFTLVPNFTVVENLALARLPSLWSCAKDTGIANRALKIASDLGWEINPTAVTGDLAVGVQQRIEILKALSGQARVLVFDEPTAVLAPSEVDDLLRVLRQLKTEGKTVILIAHKLSEVMAIADRVSVLRRGKLVQTASISEVTPSLLATWMVGEMPTFVENKPSLVSDGIVVHDLSVKGDQGILAVRGVSFEAPAGQILGIGGVDGNGQVELAEALVGIRESRQGAIKFNKLEPSIAYIPQDRQLDGLALDMSVSDNMLIGGLHQSRLRSGIFFRPKTIVSWAKALIDRFEIRAESPAQPVRSLSGGNQQKVVVSRNLDQLPDVLIACNPTRGLDVRATDYVHRKILEVRNAGKVVVLFSTDLDELAALSDKTLFMSRGQLLTENTAEALVGGSN